MKAGYNWAEVVEMSIRIERSGESFYTNAAGLVDGQKTRDVLRALAQDERRHAEIFSSLMPRGFGEGTKGIKSEEAAPYLDVVVSQSLLRYLKEADGTGFGSPREVLEFALGFERDTVQFYESLMQYLTGAAEPAVQRIISEEKGHIARIEELRRSL